jgi:CBS domain containing-hemolysin-like protein
MHFGRQKNSLETEPVSKGSRPSGVTLLGALGFLSSILLVILAGFTFILSGFFLLASSSLANVVNKNVNSTLQGSGGSGGQNFLGPIIANIGNAANGVAQAMGVVGGVLGILGVVMLVGVGVVMLVSWGLWTGRNWARILTLFGLVLEMIPSALLIAAAVIAGSFGVPPMVMLGIGILGCGWLTANIYVFYYLTRSHVARYYKHAKAPVLTIPQAIPQTVKTP